MNTQEAIKEVCNELCSMLLEKNRKYGDSAINPIRIFSKGSPMEQLNVRLDDKLARLLNQQEDEDEDVDQDLIGYLILKKVWIKLNDPGNIQPETLPKIIRVTECFPNN